MALFEAARKLEEGCGRKGQAAHTGCSRCRAQVRCGACAPKLRARASAAALALEGLWRGGESERQPPRRAPTRPLPASHSHAPRTLRPPSSQAAPCERGASVARIRARSLGKRCNGSSGTRPSHAAATPRTRVGDVGAAHTSLLTRASGDASMAQTGGRVSKPKPKAPSSQVPMSSCHVISVQSGSGNGSGDGMRRRWCRRW